jgi:hypothetical protein
MSVDPQKTHKAGLSQEQAGETGGARPQGTISAERLREVLDRLKTGFYDRPEVRDQFARGVTSDLDTRPTE